MNNEFCDFCTFTESQDAIGFGGQAFSCISLQKCLNKVIADLKAGTIKQDDIIINDLPGELLVSTHKEILAEIIKYLVNTVVINSKNNIIHISAKLVGNITLMHIRNSHAEYSNDIAERLQGIESMAERLGGCVTISNNRMYGLNLVFTFINH
jgi:hypothetical protein